MLMKIMKTFLRRCLTLFTVFFIIWPAGSALAQTSEPSGPVYIVQAGDTLLDIAQRFGVSLDDLATTNGISNLNQLTEGEKLVIPGLEGIQGTLITKTLSYGESLRGLSRRYRIPEPVLARLNHLSSPEQLYAGYNLVIPSENAAGFSAGRAGLAQGQSLLELAVLQNANPWDIVTANNLSGTVSAIPGDTLLLPGLQAGGPSALPGVVNAVEISPLPLLQGKVSVIRVKAGDGLSFSGALMGHELHFFHDSDGSYVALQGVHAMAEPGMYPLSLGVTLEDGTQFNFSQLVNVQALNYPYDRPLTVDPTTIDPAVTRPEDAQWSALTSPVTPEKYWSGKFRLPTTLPLDYCLETGNCWTSRFGNRRSYNGSPYNTFHTGLDIAGGVGTEIVAPAAGVVVFTGFLTVRGNATVINHGWGVYSCYMHQSEFDVKVGDHVEVGQLIGKVGGTGRVEGPHLHWEIWAGGVQVEPMDWLENTFP
jgi:murein DD-endopeptidase MepM/ murein hydrolase activator NlpD